MKQLKTLIESNISKKTFFGIEHLETRTYFLNNPKNGENTIKMSFTLYHLKQLR